VVPQALSNIEAVYGQHLNRLDAYEKHWVEEPHNCEICDVGKTRKTIRDKTPQLAIEQYCANGRTTQLAIIRLVDSGQ